jgi:hypothetical protein
MAERIPNRILTLAGDEFGFTVTQLFNKSADRTLP